MPRQVLEQPREGAVGGRAWHTKNGKKRTVLRISPLSHVDYISISKQGCAKYEATPQKFTLPA